MRVEIRQVHQANTLQQSDENSLSMSFSGKWLLRASFVCVIECSLLSTFLNTNDMVFQSLYISCTLLKLCKSGSLELQPTGLYVIDSRKFESPVCQQVLFTNRCLWTVIVVYGNARKKPRSWKAFSDISTCFH